MIEPDKKSNESIPKWLERSNEILEKIRSLEKISENDSSRLIKKSNLSIQIVESDIPITAYELKKRPTRKWNKERQSF
jgi:seryl-tRNA synthetase